MEPSIAAVVTKAMEGLTARLAATAENIANANTSNYRPIRVTFEDALARAAHMNLASVESVKPKFARAPLDEGGLRLDLEMLSESQTAERYSALVEILNRQFQIDGLAIMGTGQG